MYPGTLVYAYIMYWYRTGAKAILLKFQERDASAGAMDVQRVLRAGPGVPRILLCGLGTPCVYVAPCLRGMSESPP